MRISTRARLSAGFFISIALVFTTVSLFTCHWLNFNLMGTHLFSKGLFAQGGCNFYSSSPAWNTAVFALMIAALALEVIFVVFVLISSLMPHCGRHGHHMINLDVLLCFLIFATQTAALITYGISSNNAYHEQDGPNFSHSMGWSFWLVIPGAVFGLIAIGPLTHALHVIHLGGGDEDWHFSFCVRRFNAHVLRVNSGLIGLSTLFLFVGTVTYLIGALCTANGSVDFGYSFVMACIATAISAIAGGPVGHAVKRIRDCGDCECEGYYY